MNPAFYIIPIVLIGFFAWKGIREPVFFVGIPLLVGFNRAIFLDLFSLEVPLGFIDLRQEDVLFLTVLAVYVLVRLIRPLPSDRRMTLHLYLIVAILIILVTKIFAVGVNGLADLVSPGHFLSAIKTGLLFQQRTLLYLPLSLLLWCGVLRRFSRQEMVQVFSAITFVTAGFSLLYLADLLGFHIYTHIWSPYMVDTAAEGGTVFRDYVILPFWLNLALGFSLAQVVFRARLAINLPVAILLTVCTALSFTRMYVMSAIALWGIMLLWWLIRLLRFGRARSSSSARSGKIAMVFAVAAVEASVAFIMVRVSTLTTLGTYLAQRFSTITGSAGVDPNITVRTNLFSLAFKTIQKDGLVLGILAPVGQTASVYFLDSYWAQALVSLGFLGTFCVALLALNALVQGGRAAFNANGDVAHFGLAVFLGLLMALLQSISNAGFMYSVAVSTFLVAVAVNPSWRSAGATSTPTGE